MSIWWANERPASSDSEDSEHENIEWPKNNYTLSHITIANIIIILAAISLCLLQRKVSKEQNGQFEREQKLICIDLLQSCEEQVNTFKAERRQHESEKQKYEKNFQQVKEKLELAEKRFNALKCEFAFIERISRYFNFKIICFSDQTDRL